MKKLKLLGLSIVFAAVMGTCSADSLEQDLLQACKENNNEEIKRLINQGADVNTINDYYETPLYKTIINGNLEGIKILIKANVNINEENSGKNTFLHYAAKANNKKMMKILIEGGINVDAKNIYNQTPLHRASHNHKLSAIKLLIKRDANINAQDINSETPLHSTSRNDDLEATALLVQHGADVTIQNGWDDAPRNLTKDPKVKAYLLCVEDFYKVLQNTITFDAFAQKHLLKTEHELPTNVQTLLWLAKKVGLTDEKYIEFQNRLNLITTTEDQDNLLNAIKELSEEYLTFYNKIVDLEKMHAVFDLLHLSNKIFFDTFVKWTKENAPKSFNMALMDKNKANLFLNYALQTRAKEDLKKIYWLQEYFNYFPVDNKKSSDEKFIRYFKTTLKSLPQEERDKIIKMKNECLIQKQIFLSRAKTSKPFGDLKIYFKNN